MQQPARLAALAAALVALVAATACSDAPTATAPTATASDARTRKPRPPADTAIATPPAASYAVATCAGRTLALSADEMRSLDLHNQQRAAASLPAFCVDSILTVAARAHSAEMLAKNYFSHDSYGGETFSARLVRYGYTGWTALAENIAYGSGSYGTADAIFASWMNSAGHRANILNGALRQIGIGAQTGTFQGWSGTAMYTADFGTR